MMESGSKINERRYFLKGDRVCVEILHFYTTGVFGAHAPPHPVPQRSGSRGDVPSGSCLQGLVMET